MANPTLDDLRTRYGEMSQEKLDKLCQENLTDVARTAYFEEQFRRKTPGYILSNKEEACKKVHDLSLKEIIIYLKEVLGTEYKI